MVNREKRLEKGIKSLEEQKRIHEEKRKHAEELGDDELVRYYDKEIEKFEKEKIKKEEKLEK
ncbi:MAG: hypothetical protein WC781_02300 [Candidatus Pacearchaeota archaeon]|jgi:hypothetical protein